MWFSDQGLGVVCNKEGGFTEDDFVVEFLGEVMLHFNIFTAIQILKALAIPTITLFDSYELGLGVYMLLCLN